MFVGVCHNVICADMITFDFKVKLGKCPIKRRTSHPQPSYSLKQQNSFC